MHIAQTALVHLDEHEEVLSVLRQAGEPDLGQPAGSRQRALGAVRQDVADVPHRHARDAGVEPHSQVLVLFVVLPAAEVLRGDRLGLRPSGVQSLEGLPVLPRVLLVASLIKRKSKPS